MKKTLCFHIELVDQDCGDIKEQRDAMREVLKKIQAVYDNATSDTEIVERVLRLINNPELLKMFD